MRRAWAARRARRCSEALAACDAALALAPRFFGAGRERVLALLDSGDAAAATRALSRLLAVAHAADSTAAPPASHVSPPGAPPTVGALVGEVQRLLVLSVAAEKRRMMTSGLKARASDPDCEVLSKC